MKELEAVVRNWVNEDIGYINIDAANVARNTITFNAGPGNCEMLKVSEDGFWVRGLKVEQDDKEAQLVYNSFKEWLIWQQLSR